MADIKTSGGRGKLPISKQIVWTKHAIGQYVGFRKTGPETGTWWARYRDSATRKQHYTALGEFADHQQARRYHVALAAAIEWFRQADAGVTPHRKTVGDAFDDYVTAIRRDNAEKADRTEADFRRLVRSDPIVQIELGKLRRADVEQWRTRISTPKPRVGNGRRVKNTPRALATINRDLVPVRAALNLALDHGLLTSDIAWRVALKPIKNADRQRDIYLDRAERAKLLESASSTIKPFLQGMSLLPVRPGALAALLVGDFDKRRTTLRVGVDKAGRERRIKLPPATAAFLAEQARGKLPAAPLIARPDGSKWDRHTWKDEVKAAVLSAGLRPDATAYVLRHSVITDLIVDGLDLLTVALIAGTSVAMIEAHYGHLRQDRAAEALAGLAL